MIHLCPYCGHDLKFPIQNGITNCCNCRRFFDSSPFHRLLSAAWMVRKKAVNSSDHLQSLGFTEEESDLVINFVEDQCFSHEEFMIVLRERQMPLVFQNYLPRTG